jgi:hypothetical protein
VKEALLRDVGAHGFLEIVLGRFEDLSVFGCNNKEDTMWLVRQGTKAVAWGRPETG